MHHHGFLVSTASAAHPQVDLEYHSEIRHYPIPMVRRITLWRDMVCLLLLIRLMLKLRPDIVHTHTPKAGLLGMLAARFTRVPIRIHTVGGLPFMTTTGSRRRLLIAMEKLTYWGAQHVWPNSASMMAYMREERLCPEQKLEMIAGGSTNGIDLSAFSRAQVSEERLQTLRQSFSYDANATWVVAIGRVVKDKGITELVAAFEALQPVFPQLRLLLAGPIEEERDEERLPLDTLAHIRDNPAIQHLPWVEDVAACLCLADVLVHASHREGFPNVPLQAGAIGCPIVCSAIAGNVDIVSHQETGLTYPVGDTAALTATLRRVLEDPAEAQVMALQLRQKVAQQFDRRMIHRALLERYRECWVGVKVG